MSTINESRALTTVQETSSNRSVVTYQTQNVAFPPTVSYTSSLIVNLQQLQTNLHSQYQYEKNALSELNKHFRLFLEHVQHLESQNASYIQQLADLRRQAPNFNYADAQWSQSYLHFQSDLAKVNKAKLDYDFEIEAYDLQAKIYRQLFDVEQQWKDDRKLKLEQVLKNSSSELNVLRGSFADTEKEVERLSLAYGDMISKYIRLSKEWTDVRRQTKEWEFNSQMLKNHIMFYKSIRSSATGRSYESITVAGESRDFWAAELDKSIKRIRRDFELLYGTIHREMVSYYDVKMEEVHKEAEQIRQYQTVSYEETTTVQTLQVEYERYQQTLTYEREMTTKLETMYSKLEGDFRAIQIQNEERFELQSKEMYTVQESVLDLAYDIDEIRRRKIHLEAEIIVYRHLLGIEDTNDRLVNVPQTSTTSTTRSEMIGKYVINSKKKGSIGIKECSPNGSFISLANHSTTKDIDISRWLIIRRVESTTEHRFVIPDGTRLRKGEEIRIYSKFGINNNEASMSHRGPSSSNYVVLNNRELTSWGSGTIVETYLFNEDGEEKAAHTQTMVIEQKR